LKKIIIILLIFIGNFYYNVNAQINSFGVGLSSGAGSLSGNFPSQTTFTTKFFVETTLSLLPGLSFRSGFLYNQKIEVLFPEDKANRYYPFIKGYELSVLLKQNLTKLIYLEESAGISYINNRTFFDRNDWSPGVIFSIASGLDLSEQKKGLKIGIGFEYGTTFDDESINYTSIHLHIKYNIF